MGHGILRCYELQAIDEKGEKHVTRAQFKSRAAALRDCKEFFGPEKCGRQFGKFRNYRVLNSRELERRFVKDLTCARCRRSPCDSLDGNFWLVSDRKWLASVPKRWRNSVLCRPCFDVLEKRALRRKERGATGRGQERSFVLGHPGAKFTP